MEDERKVGLLWTQDTGPEIVEESDPLRWRRNNDSITRGKSGIDGATDVI